MESPDPNIGLFANRGVNLPLSILDQFRKSCRIAIALAVRVGKLVLGSEMKNINRLSCVFEVLIVNSLEMGIKLAVVVEYEKLWCRLGGWKNSLCKRLIAIEIRHQKTKFEE